MESVSSAFKRPLNEVEENNALLRRLHQEEEKKKEKQRNRWTLSEDLKLRELVAVSGPRKWTHIGKKMQGRTAKTCRSRWFNHLDPSINNDAFTDKEGKKLLKAHRELGSKWSKIAKLFHGRNDRAVNKHWHRLMKQKLKKQSTCPHERTANDKTEGFTDSVRDESTEINNSSWEMPQEETTDLKAKYLKEAMQYSARHHHFSNFPAVSLAMFTPHVSISQPSSSSSSSSSSLPSKAEDTKANIPPKFIDFLGVGDS